MKQPQGKEITGSKTGTQKKKEGQSKHKSSRDSSEKKVCKPTSASESTFVFRLAHLAPKSIEPPNLII